MLYTAPLFAFLFSLLAVPIVGQEHGHGHGHGHGRRWSVGAQAIPLLTHATPAAFGESRTEGYLTQPTVMGRARLWGGWVELGGMLNLEGLTLERGELNAGIWGEGYIDRRHPHTYLHEAVATVGLGAGRGAAASVTLGKGFAPFGTDDPMVRPMVKFPVNHHLAQILERLVAIAAVRAGPVVLEAGAFNGDEPVNPRSVGTPARLGDSWAVRATLLPLPGVETQASYAAVASPEAAAGSGLEHRKHSASARYERGSVYALGEWAHTAEYNLHHRLFSYSTWLAEAGWPAGSLRLAARYERTLRPEEERLADPFRTPQPHVDASILGITRWDVATARAEATPAPARWLQVTPFVEVTRLHAMQERRPSAFVPADFYGSERMWSLSLGATLRVGEAHGRMGRYGVALPPAAAR